MLRACFILIVLLYHFHALAQSSLAILPLKERAKVQDELVLNRINNLLPQLMRQHGIDLWVLIAREYNEDPVVKTMLPATWLNARRRTILLLNDEGRQKGIERLAVARYDVGNLFKGAWVPEQEPNQWKRLAKIISERAPKRVALNFSSDFAHADGMTKSEWDSLMSYLPAKTKASVVSAEKLAVDWLQVRTEKELEVYEHISALGHAIIADAFSATVIHPGITTTEDVVWWMRERVAGLKLTTWFHPTVDIQRANAGEGDSQRSFAQGPAREVILPGDLIHVDFGISYLGLNTDVQQLAYILKPGENDAPDFLKKALAVGNSLQDILTSNFVLKKSGNEILKLTLQQAKEQGIVASIYTHPIGYHGHAAGPAIGMWDMQGGVPGSGEYPLLYNTAYAIELNAKVVLAEWNGKEVRVMLEEQAVFTPKGVRYINGRQKKFILIPLVKDHLLQ